MVFDLIVSALVTVLVVTLTDGILTFFGNGLMNIGYRSAWIGPGGLRPSVRTMILTAAALLSFCLTFYFLMRETIRYIGKILEKVKEISAGDFDHLIEVKGNDEFSVMAENLNTMQQNIKEIMERERIAEHTKNDLVSSVAHDLRTPLTSIIGYLGLIEDNQYGSEEELKKYTHTAFLKSKQMKSLVDDLFEYTKVRQPDLPLSIVKIDLGAMLEQIGASYELEGNKKGMEVEVSVPDEPVFMEADGEKLARVFNNLISNAFKYGRDGKHVYLSVKQLSSKEVVVKIENDGEPIPEAAVPQLFDRFYRAESSRSRETGGSGLGLAIVQSIVERHNGYIYVESNAALTSFVMHFPTEHKNVVRKPAKAEKRTNE